MEDPNPLLPFAELKPVDFQPLKNLKVSFFIDVSGSTANPFLEIETRDGSKKTLTVLDIEKEFVKKFETHLGVKSKMYVSWCYDALCVQDLSELISGGGTCPESIFMNSGTKDILKNTEVAVIITDGEINGDSINRFGKEMMTHACHLKAVIGVVVGRRSRPNERTMKPSEVNISPLLPAASSTHESCLLFYNYKTIYLMWSSGIFKTSLNPVDITNSLDWPNVSTANFETISQIQIPIYDPREQRELPEKGYVPIESGKYFHPVELLKYKPSLEEFLSLPYERICLYFRITHQCERLIIWFTEQKDRFLNSSEIDILHKETAEKMFADMARPCDQRRVDRASINSYTHSIRIGLAHRYPNDQEINRLAENQLLIRLIIFYRNMMRVIYEDMQTQHQGSTYTSVSVSSTRYHSTSYQTYSRVMTQNVESCIALTAPLSQPYLWGEQFFRMYPDHQSKKVECCICFEENIPFILLRKKFALDGQGINDLLDNPLSYFYPDVFCHRCADHFVCQLKTDPVRVPCYAAFPLINLNENTASIYRKYSSSLVERRRHLVSDIGASQGLTDEEKNTSDTVRDIFLDKLLQYVETDFVKEIIAQLKKTFTMIN